MAGLVIVLIKLSIEVGTDVMYKLAPSGVAENCIVRTASYIHGWSS